jgi:Gpi18-like mannosyltransferase
MLPTVVFNGAYWGQCDAIYVSICLMALYLGMTRRSAGCLFLFGVALSFKLQTVFFLPVMLPLWLRRGLKLRHLPLIPAAYLVMMIPAVWGGKSLHHVLTCYSSQAGKYNFISMNGTNVWHLLPRDVMGQYAFRMFGTLDYTVSTIIQPVQEIAETAVSTVLSSHLSTVPSLICLPVQYAAGGTTRD